MANDDAVSTLSLDATLTDISAKRMAPTGQPQPAAALPDGRGLVASQTVALPQGVPVARREITAAPYKVTVSIEGARLVFESDTADTRTVFDLAPFDAEGGLILQVFGYRKDTPAEPWNALVAGLPRRVPA